uniref:Abhydrolase domain-containing protein 16A n=1 Tax=Rodentolepis nana TaxID=102285 RepID=A0A0R3T1E7_RODNA
LANPIYKRFVITYLNAEDQMDQNLIDALTLYGFRYPWPAQFDVRDLEPNLRFERKSIPPRCKEPTLLSPILWLLANSIGVRMIYPGCLGVFNSMTMEPRMKSLEIMRNSFSVRRVGLITREGLFVESFYIDRRNDDTETGNILVICCEGNTSYSEIGIVSVPLNEGYSVLAWNHPGFGSSMRLGRLTSQSVLSGRSGQPRASQVVTVQQVTAARRHLPLRLCSPTAPSSSSSSSSLCSSLRFQRASTVFVYVDLFIMSRKMGKEMQLLMGMPFPEQEQNAIEAVVLFALHQLHFEPEDIRLFGWSIGGFTATWAAMHLPRVGGLILDATFDTLDDLSRGTVPIFGETIPVAVVQRYFDLNNAELITRYPGPIRLIRRSNDEVITTDPDNALDSNRGNFLALSLLKYRFPHLFNPDTEPLLWSYLTMTSSQQKSYREHNGIVGETMLPILQREFRKEMLNFACDDDDDDYGGLSMEVRRSVPFPSHLGEKGISDAMKRSLLIYLASRYFVEAPGSHCSPLEERYFREPWSESLVLSRSHTVSLTLESEEDTSSEREEEDGNGWEKVA